MKCTLALLFFAAAFFANGCTADYDSRTVGNISNKKSAQKNEVRKGMFEASFTGGYTYNIRGEGIFESHTIQEGEEFKLVLFNRQGERNFEAITFTKKKPFDATAGSYPMEEVKADGFSVSFVQVKDGQMLISTTTETGELLIRRNENGRLYGSFDIRASLVRKAQSQMLDVMLRGSFDVPQGKEREIPKSLS